MVHHPPPLPQWLQYKTKSLGLLSTGFSHQPVKKGTVIARAKSMAGTVVQGARVWTGPSRLARSRNTSPKTAAFPLWSPYTLTLILCLQAVPSYPGIWLEGGKLIFCLDQLVFSPLPAFS